MTNLPEVTWTPLWLPNPNRKWWQFWKPRQIVNPEAITPLFQEGDTIFDGIIWKEVEDANLR